MSDKVSIEPIIPSAAPATSAPSPSEKKYVTKVVKVIKDAKTGKIIKKIVKKIPVEQPVQNESTTQDSTEKPFIPPSIGKQLKKKYASASSGVPLEVRNQQLLIGGTIVGAITIISTFALFYFRTKVIIEKDVQVEDTSSEEIVNVDDVFTPSPTSTTSAVSELSKDEISLEILNGSGVSGLAGDTADEFDGLGYSEITTGNADVTEESKLYISDKYTEQEVDNLLTDTKRRLGIDAITDFKEIDTVAQIILGQDQK